MPRLSALQYCRRANALPRGNVLRIAKTESHAEHFLHGIPGRKNCVTIMRMFRRLQQMIARLSATRPGAWVVRTCIQPLDRFVLWISGGRFGIVSLFYPTLVLITALITQLLFYALVAINVPALYADGMSPALLGLMSLLTIVVAVGLVSGAVSFSIHAGSVREASMMASAVLLPTTALLQAQAPYFIARRFDVVWLAILAITVVALAFLRSGMQTFQRAAIFSRNRETMSLRRIWSTFRRFFSEYQPAGTPLYAYRGLPFSPWRFYRYEFPALLYELRLPLAVSMLAAVSGTVLGLTLSQTLVLPPVEQALTMLAYGPAPSLLLAGFVFANNLRVSILSNLLAPFSLGVFPFLVPAVVFAQIGYISGRILVQNGATIVDPLQFIVAYLLPHGVIELPTFLISAALGLRMGAALLSTPGNFTVGENLLWAAAQTVKVWLLIIAPLVLVAALIEGLITPLVIMWVY